MNLSKMIVLPLGALALAAGLAACGSSDSSASSAESPAVSSSPTPAPTSTTSGQPSEADREALRTCLAGKGITLPSRDPNASAPSGMPTSAPTGQPQGSQGLPGGGAGPQLPDGVDQQAFQDAMQACGGRMGAFAGGPGGPGGTAFEAYRSCLTDHGVTLPTTAGSRPNLDQGDPKVAAAMKTCAPLMPSRAPAPAAS